jgi:hypothetical protein
MAVSGLLYAQELNRSFFCRISQTDLKSYEDINPGMDTACLLTDGVPESFVKDLRLANTQMINASACKID